MLIWGWLNGERDFIRLAMFKIDVNRDEPVTEVENLTTQDDIGMFSRFLAEWIVERLRH